MNYEEFKEIISILEESRKPNAEIQITYDVDDFLEGGRYFLKLSQGEGLVYKGKNIGVEMVRHDTDSYLSIYKGDYIIPENIYYLATSKEWADSFTLKDIEEIETNFYNFDSTIKLIKA